MGIKTRFLLLTCLTVLICADLYAQELDVVLRLPGFLRNGDRIELPVSLYNKTAVEVKGHVTLSMREAGKQESVDGWFMNSFPSQYFSLSVNERALLFYPIQVPYEVNKTIALTTETILAGNNNINKQDSFIIPLPARHVKTSAVSLSIKKRFINSKHQLVLEQDELHVGDTITVRLEIRSRIARQKLLIRDEIAATLLPITVGESGIKIQGDFVEINPGSLNKGQTVIEYKGVIQYKGSFNAGVASIHSATNKQELTSSNQLKLQVAE